MKDMTNEEVLRLIEEGDPPPLDEPLRSAQVERDNPLPGGTKRGKAKRAPRCSAEEMDNRVAYTAALICRHAYPSEVKHILFKRYGVEYRAASQYISRARKLIAEQTGITPEAAKDQSLAFWHSVIRDPDATLREKMAAQEQLDSIHGVRAPVKVAQTDSHGEDLEYIESLRSKALQDGALRELMADMADRVAGINTTAEPPRLEYGLKELEQNPHDP